MLKLVKPEESDRSSSETLPSDDERLTPMCELGRTTLQDLRPWPLVLSVDSKRLSTGVSGLGYRKENFHYASYQPWQTDGMEDSAERRTASMERLGADDIDGTPTTQYWLAAPFAPGECFAWGLLSLRPNYG
jgi:hypothetical protein